MASSPNRIVELVQHLENELRQNPSLSDDARDSLKEALGEIQTALDQPEDAAAAKASERHQWIGSRLQGAVEEFEASHPDLADAINRLLNNLGQIGL